MSTPKVVLIFGAGANTGLATAKKFAQEGYMIATIEPVFEQVNKNLGSPHVVVYNAADAQFTSNTNPLDVSPHRLAETLAVKLWATLPAGDTAFKTFLSTRGAITLGVGKNGTAYWLEAAAAAYRDRGYKFYYVDERTPEGESTMIKIDGPAHAEEFWRLAEVEKEWCWTYVKGKGYVGNKLVVDRELRTLDLPGLPEGGVSYDEIKKLAATSEEVANSIK